MRHGGRTAATARSEPLLRRVFPGASGSGQVWRAALIGGLATRRIDGVYRVSRRAEMGLITDEIASRLARQPFGDDGALAIYSSPAAATVSHFTYFSIVAAPALCFSKPAVCRPVCIQPCCLAAAVSADGISRSPATPAQHRSHPQRVLPRQ